MIHSSCFMVLLLMIPFITHLQGEEVRRSKYFIAIQHNYPGVLKHLKRYTSFLPPKGQLYADPMLFKKEGINYIFFEEYDYKKGTIAYVTINENLQVSKPVRVLEFDQHLSFPFVFKDDCEIYMTPETIESNEVALYRAVDFPNNWEKDSVLVSGEDYTDPIIFKHNGYYWLFTAARMWRLRIFYSESLGGPFLPHPINKQNIPGRNAGGVFYLEDRLIRPTMDCSENYGQAMILKEIVELSPDTFIERIVQRIDPIWAPHLNGTHTFNMNDDLVIYDGRRSILPSEDHLYSSPD